MIKLSEKLLIMTVQICIIIVTLYKHISVINALHIKHKKQDLKASLAKEKEQLVYTLAQLHRHDYIQTIAQSKLNLKPISVQQIRYIPN